MTPRTLPARCHAIASLAHEFPRGHAIAWAVVWAVDVVIHRAVEGVIPGGLVAIGLLIAPLHALELAPPQRGWPLAPRCTRLAAFGGLIAVGADTALTAAGWVGIAHAAETVAVAISVAVCVGLSGLWPWRSAEISPAMGMARGRRALELIVLAAAAGTVVWSFETPAGLARLVLLPFVVWESLASGRARHRQATTARVAGAICIGALSLASGHVTVQILGSLAAAAVASRALQDRLEQPELAWLVFLAVAAQVPYLVRDFLVLHDTMLTFQLFYAFLGEFMAHGELPHWLPYGDFGLRAPHFQMTTLTATDYLVGLTAALVGFRDAYAAFLLSVVLGHLVFVLGAHRLAAYLFLDRRTIFLVCAVLVGTTTWESSVSWTLRLVQLLPLCIYLVLRFLDDLDLTYLAAAALVFTISALGFGYAGIAVALSFVPLVAFLAADRLRQRLHLRSTPGWALPTCGAFVMVTTAWLVCHAEGLRGLQPLLSGRASASGQVPIASFLTYGGNATWSTLLECFLLGWPLVLPVGWHAPWSPAQPVWGDQAVYVGLLPIAMIAVAVATARSRRFFAFLAPACALVWLSFGGLFAILVWALPGLEFYRHLAHTYALVKVFLVFAAGFGLEHVWRRERAVAVVVARMGAWLLAHRWRSILIVAIALWFLLDTSYAQTLRETGVLGLVRGAERAAGAVVRTAALLLLVAYAARAVRRDTTANPGRLLFALFTIWLSVDLGVYNVQRMIHTPRLERTRPGHLAALRVEPLPYRAQRQDEPPEGRSSVASELTLRGGVAERGAVYTLGAGFLQFDPYLAMEFRRDIVSRDTYRLLQALDAVEPGGMIRQRLDDSPSRVLLGAETPKLRLVPVAEPVRDQAEAERLLRQRRKEGRAPNDILIVESVDTPGAESGPPVAGVSDRVDVVSFRANRLAARADVSAVSGAWLVYADAFDPWWRARVNGQERPIVRANIAFKAIYLRPGTNHVELEVHPPWWLVLSTYTVAATGAFAALILLGWFVSLLAATR